MRLEEYATGNVVTVLAGSSIDDAIRLQKQHHIRHLPVIRDGVLVGIVSTGDVLAAVGGLLSDERVSTFDPTVPYAGPTTVDEIMSTNVVSLSPDDSIPKAARIMLERQIAAVPVVSNHSVVGMITEMHCLQQFFDHSTVIPEECRRQPVADHMSTEITAAAPGENLFELMRDMKSRLRHLPVVDDGKLVGILSDHDVRRAMALDSIEQIVNPEERIRLTEHFSAGSIMTENLQTTTPATTLSEAAKQMCENAIGALPVMENEKMVGIITETDLLRAYVSALPAPA